MSVKPEPCADKGRNFTNLLEVIGVHWDYDTQNPNRHEVALELARAVLINNEYALNHTPTRLTNDEGSFIASKLMFMLKHHCLDNDADVLYRTIHLICEIYEIHYRRSRFSKHVVDAVETVRVIREHGGKFAEQCKRISINGLRYKFLEEPSIFATCRFK